MQMMRKRISPTTVIVFTIFNNHSLFQPNVSGDVLYFK